MQSEEAEQEKEKAHFRQKTQAETKARAATVYATLYSIPVNVCCSVARTPLQFESILNVIE
jgi:hypothetical protein